jgi:HD-GYP domain-containing protein (c-di-GMP phosphodiesterase class II)
MLMLFPGNGNARDAKRGPAGGVRKKEAKLSKKAESRTEDLGVLPPEGHSNRPMLIVAGLVILVSILAFFLVFRFAGADRERGLQAWQNQLNIVADSRAAAVTDWLDGARTAMRKVAANQSLSFYLTELSWSGKPEKVTDGNARLAIIGNFLKWSADQSGFDAPPTGADVAANVERKGRAGIAVTDPNGKIMTATPFMPPVEAVLGRYLKLHPSGVYVDDVVKGPAGDPAIAFVTPVYAEQAATDNQVVGYVVGIRPLGNDLFNRLKQPGDVTRSAETYLVRQDGNQIDFLSPLADGSAPLSRHFALDTPGLAAAYALATPGGFAVRRDYNGAQVLVTSRFLGTPPWTLVRVVSASESLGEIDGRRNRILVILGLSILSVAAGLLLIWRHGASVRVAEAASRFEKLSSFLRIVSDSQPTAISVVGADEAYNFANAQAGRDAGMDPADMLGKKLSSILAPFKARVLAEDNRRVLQTRAAVSAVHSFEEGDKTRIIKADHRPLNVNPDGGHALGVLMVLEDITDLVNERERRENNLRQLVTTLATIIDGRDPYSAHHSKRVAEVAETIAQEMNLGEVEVETAGIAGALMNLGKIMVPVDVLTKPGQISGKQLDDIRRHVLASADLLKNVSFDGPVVETIRQVQAHFDGTGLPEGLKGEDILITARVVAVANAFVGMVSARAHRPGLDTDIAISHLHDQSGKIYDRRPVASLINYLDNRQGRDRWGHFSKPPEK